MGGLDLLLSPWEMPVDKQPIFSTCLNICPGEICLGFQAHAPLSLRWALVGEADRPIHRASQQLNLTSPRTEHTGSPKCNASLRLRHTQKQGTS